MKDVSMYTLLVVLRHVGRVEIGHVPRPRSAGAQLRINAQINITFDTFPILSYEAQIQKFQVKWKKETVHGD